MKIKQTAGRDSLGDFAPEFAKLNDDILFGEVWSGDGLSLTPPAPLSNVITPVLSVIAPAHACVVARA